jgi:hypothetical protein
MIASLLTGLAHALLYVALTTLGLLWLASDTSDTAPADVQEIGQAVRA